MPEIRTDRSQGRQAGHRACHLQKARPQTAWLNRTCHMDLSLNSTLSLTAKRPRVSHSPGTRNAILEKHPACLALKRPVACRHSRTDLCQETDAHTVPMRHLKAHLLHHPTEGIHHCPVKSNSRAPCSISKSHPLFQEACILALSLPSS